MINFNRSNSFAKEVFVALIILGNFMILPLHLFASPEASVLRILGYEYVHWYPSNQSFFWSMLSKLQILAYTMLLFCLSNRRYKYALLLLAYWMVYEMFWDIVPWEGNTAKFIIQIVSMFFVLIIAAVQTPLGSFTNNAPCKLDRLDRPKLDIVITFILVLLLVLRRLSLKLPIDLEELNLFGFTISAYGFPNMSNFLGYLSVKILLLVPVVILFKSSKKWWRYTLLAPILLAVLQVKTALNPDLEDIDAYEIVEAAQFLILVLLLLLFLSNTAFYHAKMAQLYQRTYNHLELAIQKRFRQRELFLTKSKDKWEALQKKQDANDAELLQLKQHLEQELQKPN
ncbi:MAG: hypothetical protein AAGF96_01870 [Bacteroidota bacterium]